jgi:outer membrane receptor protein involved in Fe transport
MQRYLGGNSDALAAITDGARNVGALYGYDRWTLTPRLRFEYGARYASYDYLDHPGLLSPESTVFVRPSLRDSLVLRVSAAHREIAPGAHEFLPPAGGVYLPPERTFSSVSRDNRFRTERLDHFEVAAERELVGGFLLGVRGFRERVADQNVTLFGAGLRHAKAGVGHYYVGSAGSVDTAGWGVEVARALTEQLRAAVDYTYLDSTWDRRSPDVGRLAQLAEAVLRDDERIHGVTARVEGIVEATATRMLMVYKVNTAFAAGVSGTAAPGFDTRFNVQVNQALPFLRLTSASLEMLVAVSNLFHDESFEGSVYDELLVVRAPTRVMGGVTVRF